MYARLVAFSGAGADKRKTMIQTVEETVIPMLRQYDGFAGYIALQDAANERAKAIILWENEGAATTAEETLAERRHGIAGGVGLTIESAELFEATVVEIEGARV
jgi:hypothetical protein